jgi:type IV secretory pathway TrbF-like protein
MSNNPYTNGNEGKEEWNDRYMNMANANRNWRIACICSLVATVILGAGNVIQGVSSKVKPYVVETNNGMPYAIQPLASISVHDEKLINFAANQFVINARTVLADPQADKILLDKVYAFAGDNAIKVLHDYYQTHNPLEENRQYTVEVNIVNSLPLSKNTWQVVWDETKRSQDGSEQSKTRWMADLSYQFGQVNSKFINENPFGLYITSISWSQSTGE